MAKRRSYIVSNSFTKQTHKMFRGAVVILASPIAFSRLLRQVGVGGERGLSLSKKTKNH